MVEFIKTIIIATIPSIIAGVSAYLAARNKSNTQIKSITEQNKADLEKLVEQHKIDLESLKEKHRMELEIKERDHLYQAELIKLQHENDLTKSEETVKNQVMSSVMSGMVGSMFNSESAIARQLNDALGKSLENAFKI